MDGLKQRFAALGWLVAALIISSAFHEAGHAWAAWRLGDRRPYIAIRKRFWSPSHISPTFTIILPAIMWLLAGVSIGGAKPVMVSTRAIGPWRMVLVALAGPAGNVFVGVLGLILIAALEHAGVIVRYNHALIGDRFSVFDYLIWGTGMSFMLAALNLLPLPPLDGSRVVAAFLPEKARNFYYHALSLPMAALILLGFFIAGKFFPQVMEPLREFNFVTLPRWVSKILEFVR